MPQNPGPPTETDAQPARSTRPRILILEDEPADAELVVRELERSGLLPRWERVDTEDAFVRALAEPPDIILSDYSMPRFDALRALEILQSRDLDIPFIIVSGTIGEDVAAAAMRAGASDYLLKDRLARLGMAVQHLIRQRHEHRARQASEEARKRLAAAVDQAGEGVVILDPSGRVEYVNPAYERTSGHSRADSIGRLFRLLDPGAASRDQGEAIRSALLAGEPWQGRIDHPSPEGETVEMDLSMSPVRDESGAVYSSVLVFRSVSERVLLERAMREAQKMEAVGRLAGGMAHDFNNLLTAILGYGELILSRLEPESKNASDLREVISAGKRGARLTRQLLSFSRRRSTTSERLDLNAAVRDMESLLRRLIGEDVEIVLNLAAELPEIWVERSQVEQVVLNLAVNARDAMPGGGRLELATRRVVLDSREAALRPDLQAGEYAVLTVADTGCGIDPETRARIFEPFFTTKGTGVGTGLGLATVFGIARQANGGVEVTSEVGRGTEFRVSFPAAEAPEDRESDDGPAAEPPETPRHGPGATILVVEDEEATRVLVARLLTEKGHEVLLARNGVEAANLLEQRGLDIDLLLTDVIMPMMSGPDLARQLREERPDLRVLFMTGYSGKLLEAHDFDSDDEYLIQKPFTLVDLDRAVRRALRPASERGPEPPHGAESPEPS